jgi:hypothetical protein
MTGPRALIAAALTGAMILAGCSSNQNDGRAELLLAAGKQTLGTITGKNPRKKGKLPPATITQQQLENTKIPALQVNLVTRGGSDFLKRATQRNDGTFGTVAVWRGTGGTEVILRNGVLVGTKGIGGDIISADAGATIRAVSGAEAGSGQRRYFLSGGNYNDTELVLSCRIANLGQTTTQVVHLAYQTVHLRETCAGGEGGRVRIANDYWVQPKSGLVRRSRQWAGPYSGYFEIILLRN